MISSVFRKTKSIYTETFRNGVVYAFFACAVVLLCPFTARAEQIDSFISDIEIAQDTTLKIKETISYKFDDQRHGIFRCIPTKHQDKASSILKDRYMDIAFTDVRMDTQRVPYEITKENERLCVKIGDPSSTITGAHTYELSYTVGGAISYETYGGADLYWNVTGNEWEVPILSVDARVSSPDQIFMTERSCYRGLIGKANSCQMSTDVNGVIHFGGTLFTPKEGLTFSQALNRSKIPIDIRERYKPLLVWPIGIVFGIVAIELLRRKFMTKFKTGRTIIPQYEPFKEAKPMYTGLLFDGRLDPRDITAGFVYLAERGFIKIRKTEQKVFFLFEVDNYEITLIKIPDETISDFEKIILSLIFDSLAEQGLTVTLSSIRNDKMRSLLNYSLVQVLRESMEKDLEENGFFQAIIGRRIRMMAMVLLIWSFFLILVVTLIAISDNAFYYTYQWQFHIGIFLWFCMVTIAASMQKRRTRKGYEALDHLRGFKQFLEVTEKQRYVFHNAPARSPEQFMEYLPYAIAFGVEKEWAKTFEGITIPNPNWYDGGDSVSTFSAVSLSQSLGGFSTSLAPSSGSSASSGGGSSGGGSGGGGGGSW